ncbi:uncharacterized protein LOC123557073 [Mercenaria mercenaria]|uniref:uncharacterized protein LOC123557073 n=1 Tax=Mercenaria mercenaria TaxID=6596 RepID=UPI00234F5E5C|nr:uncharacterized protein LOC123557073 [Mercenaria mercenaria]
MASKEIIVASDEIITVKCCVCTKKNITREAEKYCVECQDYYCIPCTDSHKMFPTLSGHQILDKDDFSSHGLHPTDLPSFPTERCSTHKAKILDMFCINHNEVVCASCVALNHRACKDIRSVPEDVDNLYKQSTFEETKMKLKAMKKTTEDIKKTREQLVRELKKSKDETTDCIRMFRKEMEAMLEKLETESIKVVEAQFERIETMLLKQIKEANKFSDDLTLFTTKLEKSAGNKAQEFVCVNQAVKTIDKTKEAEKHLRQEQDAELEFKPNVNIKTFLEHLKTLGQLSSMRTKYKPKTTAYTVRTRKRISVKLTEDRNDCCIFGSCFISDGSLLLTDFHNRKLKHVDISTATFKNHLDLCAGPYAVCQTSDDEAAVSLSNCIIQFVSLGHKMATTRQLKLDHHCYGLAHKEGKLYISDAGNTVYIHDMTGTMLCKITTDRLGNEIFSSSIHISLGTKKDKVYITDTVKGMITLDTQGSYESTFIDPDLVIPWGVCTDRKGNIFVGSLRSSKIVQISEESKKKLGVLNINMTNIFSISFYPQQNKLAVTGHDNTVSIYDLE